MILFFVLFVAEFFRSSLPVFLLVYSVNGYIGFYTSFSCFSVLFHWGGSVRHHSCWSDDRSSSAYFYLESF